MSAPYVVAAARVLAERNAADCGTDPQDTWNLYSQTFLDDAEAALKAAGAPELVMALEWALLRIRTSLDCGDRYAEAAAVLAKATRSQS